MAARNALCSKLAALNTYLKDAGVVVSEDGAPELFGPPVPIDDSNHGNVLAALTQISGGGELRRMPEAGEGYVRYGVTGADKIQRLADQKVPFKDHQRYCTPPLPSPPLVQSHVSKMQVVTGFLGLGS